jgi:hypothetical protein
MSLAEEILSELVALERHPRPQEIPLGKDGPFTQLLRKLAELNPRVRVEIGRRLNALKAKVIAAREADGWV